MAKFLLFKFILDFSETQGSCQKTIQILKIQNDYQFLNRMKNGTFPIYLYCFFFTSQLNCNNFLSNLIILNYLTKNDVKIIKLGQWFQHILIKRKYTLNYQNINVFHNSLMLYQHTLSYVCSDGFLTIDMIQCLLIFSNLQPTVAKGCSLQAVFKALTENPVRTYTQFILSMILS